MFFSGSKGQRALGIVWSQASHEEPFLYGGHVSQSTGYTRDGLFVLYSVTSHCYLTLLLLILLLIFAVHILLAQIEEYLAYSFVCLPVIERFSLLYKIYFLSIPLILTKSHQVSPPIPCLLISLPT